MASDVGTHVVLADLALCEGESGEDRPLGAASAEAGGTSLDEIGLDALGIGAARISDRKGRRRKALLIEQLRGVLLDEGEDALGDRGRRVLAGNRQ